MPQNEIQSLVWHEIYFLHVSEEISVISTVWPWASVKEHIS